MRHTTIIAFIAILLSHISTGWAIGNLACKDIAGTWTGAANSVGANPVTIKLEITEVTQVTANAPIGGTLSIDGADPQEAIGRCSTNIQGLEFFVRETDEPSITLSTGGMISPTEAHVTLVQENGQIFVGTLYKTSD